MTVRRRIPAAVRGHVRDMIGRLGLGEAEVDRVALELDEMMTAAQRRATVDQGIRSGEQRRRIGAGFSALKACVR